MAVTFTDRGGVSGWWLWLLVEYLPRLARVGQDPLAVFVGRGRGLGFIHPTMRTVITAPALPPEAFAPLPPDLALLRPAGADRATEAVRTQQVGVDARRVARL